MNQEGATSVSVMYYKRLKSEIRGHGTLFGRKCFIVLMEQSRERNEYYVRSHAHLLNKRTNPSTSAN